MATDPTPPTPASKVAKRILSASHLSKLPNLAKKLQKVEAGEQQEHTIRWLKPVPYKGSVIKKEKESNKWIVHWKSGKSIDCKTSETREDIQKYYESEKIEEIKPGMVFNTMFEHPTSTDIVILRRSRWEVSNWRIKWKSDENFKHFLPIYLRPFGLDRSAVEELFCQQPMLSMLDSSKDLDRVLDRIGQEPFCLQEVCKELLTLHTAPKAKTDHVCVGVNISKLFMLDDGDGHPDDHVRYYQGRVVKEVSPGKWRIKWNDSTVTEGMTTTNVLRYHECWLARYSYNERLGRRLNCLELCSGTGTVSTMFEKIYGPNEGRKWNVESVDVDGDSSTASIVKDIGKLRFEDLEMVPDFIWASPTCTTMSRAAGGKHRNPKSGKYTKTREAEISDMLLIKIFAIIGFFHKKNSNLIVMIENPVGHMQDLPFMIGMEQELSLQQATVDYCQFDEEYQKPTHLWTNVSIPHIVL